MEWVEGEISWKGGECNLMILFFSISHFSKDRKATISSSKIMMLIDLQIIQSFTYSPLNNLSE